jgi:hypothetical protein
MRRNTLLAGGILVLVATAVGVLAVSARDARAQTTTASNLTLEEAATGAFVKRAPINRIYVRANGGSTPTYLVTIMADHSQCEIRLPTLQDALALRKSMSLRGDTTIACWGERVATTDATQFNYRVNLPGGTRHSAQVLDSL